MKSLLSLIAAGAAALLSTTVAAQAPATDFPSKPVTIVTPFAAGSGPDAVLRLISDKLGRLWNQRVLVDNKPGGGGFIAIEQARRAAPDGYTLLQLDSEHIAALPHLYKSRNFVTLQHFDPVASLFRTPFFVAVPTDSKWKTMGDLVAAARAQPGQISYGSWGVGSPGHLGGQQLESLTGAHMQHVPYREVSQLFANVGSGEVAWSFASLPSSQGIYKAGKLRYIAIAAPKRIPQMPDVPTMAESGGPAGLEVNSFVSLLTPKGVPAAIRARINADVAKVIADPEIRARFDTFAFEPLAWSPEEIERNAEVKSKIYGELVRRGNISLE
ncbi:Bug family tripartite tricarboxylate transporter substrate binding protein [Variovorax ginsengisoli]|uniref:Tripartite tricarboxylate transporter substrate binding protein n=1 Tax=Variovorax ginsengisoli TaxID=363844 RepID=A0ABT8S5L3_9BURK|nr:tripartite tricarboxylate transporter substrate binding protein [Variovorax ginsengisoli]MDN8614860.1 tripartite tricarboxylate transporter substrate binding protein [Variovorax ginsengisoli]MDO1534030.1 tripartite tricarboxylate transporter substrate binding protein [Variovorax ginsengisoli]